MNKALYKPPLVTQKNFKQRKKIRFKNGWIYMWAQLNENDSLEFMLDSGSPSFIGFDTKNKLGVASKKVTDSLEYCSLNVTMGNITYQNATFMVLSAYEIKGLLGANLMQNQIWSFNFGDSIVTITDKLEYLQDDTNGYKIHFSPYGKQKTPLIKLVINGDSVPAFLDLGDASAINLYSGFNLTKLQGTSLNNIIPYKYKNEGRGKKKGDTILTSYIIRMNSFNIGGYSGKDIVASYNPLGHSMNLLGLDFLKNFIVTIDGIHHNIYLKPIEGRMPSTNLYSYGCSIYKTHKIWIIGSVYKGSEADKQGIMPGDEIESINGIDITNIERNVVNMIDDHSASQTEIVLKLKGKEQPIHLRKLSLFQ